MAKNNETHKEESDNASSKLRVAIVSGIFLIIATICAGTFTIINTLVDKGIVLTAPEVKGPGIQVGIPQVETEIPLPTNEIIYPTLVPKGCASTPPDDLIHFWKEGFENWSAGIWGSSNIPNFTVGLGIIDTDDPDFREFKIWIDPCLKDTIPGHGYKDNARFWPLDQKGAGLTSSSILLGKETIINIQPNTGQWGLGNPK